MGAHDIISELIIIIMSELWAWLDGSIEGKEKNSGTLPLSERPQIKAAV